MPARTGMHPVIVMPFVIQRPNNGRGMRRIFRMKSERVGFIDAVIVVTRYNVILVGVPLLHLWDELFPDARTSPRMHRMTPVVPTIETARYVHALRIGRPNGEVGTGLPVDDTRECTKVFVE